MWEADNDKKPDVDAPADKIENVHETIQETNNNVKEFAKSLESRMPAASISEDATMDEASQAGDEKSLTVATQAETISTQKKLINSLEEALFASDMTNEQQTTEIGDLRRHLDKATQQQSGSPS